MSTPFSHRILLRRRNLGLTQAQLAQELGVGQQTVARWEKAASTPDEEKVARLAQVFGEPVDEWRGLAGYGAGSSATSVDVPSRPLVGRLPLGQLSPSDFERLTHLLVQALYPAAQVHRVGGSGDAQQGADVIASLTPLGTMLFQCKRMERFGPANVRSVAEATSLTADARVLVLSRVASPAARAEASRLGWSIWDHDDIIRKLQQDLTMEAARRIVDVFFPGYREQFLGLRDAGPWSTVEEFFAGRLEEDSAFSHVWALVGREHELETLATCAESGALFCMLVGAAGVGKTRLLLEFARQVQQADSALVYFVEPTTQVRLEHFERLGVGPVTIVVDDAHEREDVDIILRGALHRSSSQLTRVVFATRPYGQALLRQDLARVAGALDVPEINLNSLSNSDARRLAAEVLGANEDSVIVGRLVDATSDCTLFTVAAGFLLKTERMDPLLLGNTESFRSAVLARMYADYVRGSRQLPGGIDAREALRFLAVAQPFDLADAEAMDAAAEILGGVQRDVLIGAIGQIGMTGVVVQRGSRLRLQPDLLADHILIEACYDAGLGLPTGYAERVWNASPSGLRRNLIVNLSRIDWRLSAAGTRQGSLLGVAWDTLENEFSAGGIEQRVSLLKLVENVAYYQPLRALALTRWALGNEIDGGEPGIFGPHTYEEVRTAAAGVLRNCAYHLEHLEEACLLLWRLAKSDSRRTGPNPEHPLRVLLDLASYSRFKPIAYVERVIDLALGWLEDPTSLSAFDICDESLKWDAEDHIADGYTIKMTSYSPLILGEDCVLELRTRVLDAILLQLGGLDVARAARAVQSLGKALGGPWGAYGRQPDDRERLMWASEAEKLLRRIVLELDLSRLDSAVTIDLREVVEPLATAESIGVASAAKEVLDALVDDLNADVAEALMHGPWRRHLRRQGGEWSAEEEQRWLNDLARQLIDDRGGASGAVDCVEGRLTAIADAAGQVSSTPGPFTAALVRLDADVGVGIVERVAGNPESSLMQVAGIALSVLRSNDAKMALKLARMLLDGGGRLAKLQVAHAYGWGLAAAPDIVGDELSLIRQLAADADDLVARNVARGFRFLAVQDPRAVVEMIVEMGIGRSPALADDTLVLFARDEPLRIEMLDEVSLAAIIDQLVECERIDEHWVGQFIGKLSRTHLATVVGLLERRIERAEGEAISPDYRPVPFGWDDKSAIQSAGHPQRRAVLDGLRDWAVADVEGWRRHYEGPRLFAAVAGEFDDEVLAIIEAGLTANLSMAKRVAHLLSEVPHGFVWSHVQWIVLVLDDSSRRDLELYRALSSALYSAVISGVRSGTPGEPFPQDLEQREKSREIADGLPAGSAGERFYRSLQRSAEESIRRYRDEDWG
ncbi:MAG: helix-turn-helix domain-containing protein [Thiobacillus sp.]